MLNVAVTGNVAAGKSTVVAWFREWGAEVIDADQLVREVQQPGSPVLTAIAERFGRDVISADGSLHRAALRERVLAEKEALAALNAIVHPAVRQRRDEFALAAAGRGVTVLINDIPLLFEVLDPNDFDLVVLVDAAPSIRRTRLITLRGLHADEADRLLESQLPSEHKRARSDIVIDNNGSLDELRTAAQNAWRAIVERAEAGAT